MDIAEIARRLNVAHIVEGSVRASGDRLRITAQLIRTADSAHMWSETYGEALKRGETPLIPLIGEFELQRRAALDELEEQEE